MMKNITKKILCILLSILILLTLVSCSTDALRGEKAIKIEQMPADNIPGVYYEIFVGGFSDSNKDGTGDIQGIINRIDYLNDGNPLSGKSLGIDGIWLMPIMQAGSYHKYDTVDYYSIDYNYGTMKDFENLIAVCNEKGIDVIIDLVLNHTSEYNKWFTQLKKAIKEGDKDNKYLDWYSITTDSSKGWHKLATDPDGVDYFYEGNFSPSMPELNMDNKEVLDEIENIVKFWLGKGVKGFRLDAVKYVYLNDDTRNIEFWKWFADTCKKYDEDVFLVAENWSGNTSIIDYYAALDCFDFGMSGSAGQVALTVNGIFNLNDFVKNICRYKENVEKSNPDAVLKPFISNHDMDRCAGYLPVKEYRMHMAANMYILTSGNPFMYYGEEIGMYGSRATSSTDANRRLAMLWGDNDTVKDPPGTTFPAERQVNGTVKKQVKRADSLYTHYKKLLALRKANPEIAVGHYTPLYFEGYNLFGGFLVEHNNVVKGVFHNLSDKPITIDLSPYLNAGTSFNSISGYIGQGKASIKKNTLTLDGMTSVILK